MTETPPDGSMTPPSSRVPPIVIVGLIVLAVVVAGLFVVHAVDDGDGGSSRAGAPHRVSASQQGTAVAQLDVVGGTDTLTIDSADLGNDLLVAATGDNSRAAPVVETNSAGRVVVTTQGDPQRQGDAPVNLTIRLARGVQWSVLVAGGSQLLRIDLSQASLASLDVSQGMGTVDLTLPNPSGTLTTRLSGGAGAVRVHLPRATAGRFTFSGGAGSATVDSQQRSGIAAGTVMTTDLGSSPESGRVDVAFDGGIGSLVVDRHS